LPVKVGEAKLLKDPEALSILILSIVLAIIPLTLLQKPYTLWIIIITIFYVVLAINWNLLLGYMKLLSFAHTGLIGIGGYGSALFIASTGLPPLIGLLVGTTLAAVTGLVLGWACLRLRGIYLALTTWGFSGSLQLLLLSEYNITGGSKGIHTKFLLPVTSFEAPQYYYYIALTLLILCMMTTYKLIHSKYGLYLRAIGDDEDAAAACGVNIIRLRIFIFTISSLWVGAAGAFYVHFLGYASPAIADFSTIMITVLGSTILGGLGTFFGPILGTFIIWPLSEVIRARSASLQMIILAAVILLSLKFFRNGFVGAVSSLYHKYKDEIEEAISRLKSLLIHHTVLA